MKKNYLLAFLVVFNLSFVFSQTNIAYWRGTNTSTASYPRSAYSTGTEINSATENYNGLNTYADNRNVWQSPSSASFVDPNTSPYLSYSLNLSTNINFDRFVLGGVSGSCKLQLRWSVDSYATSLGEFGPLTGSYQLVSVDLSSTAQVMAGDIEFRVYFYNTSGTIFNPGYYGYTSPDGTPALYGGSSATAVSIWSNSGTLGIDDLNSKVSNFDIYPNPSSDYIRVSGINNSKKYAVYNLLGNSLQKGVLESNQNTISVSQLNAGIYLLKFEDGATVKFVKE